MSVAEANRVRRSCHLGGFTRGEIGGRNQRSEQRRTQRADKEEPEPVWVPKPRPPCTKTFMLSVNNSELPPLEQQLVTLEIYWWACYKWAGLIFNGQCLILLFKLCSLNCCDIISSVYFGGKCFNDLEYRYFTTKTTLTVPVTHLSKALAQC